MSSALRSVASRASTSPLRLRPRAVSPTSFLEGMAAAPEMAVPRISSRSLRHHAPEASVESWTPRSPRTPRTPSSPTFALSGSSPFSTQAPTPPPVQPPLDNSIGGPIISMLALGLLGAGAYTLYDDEAERRPTKSASMEQGPDQLGDSSGSQVVVTGGGGSSGGITQETAVAEGTALIDPSAPPSVLSDAAAAAAQVKGRETPPEGAPAAAFAPPKKRTPEELWRDAWSGNDKERAWMAKEQAHLHGWDGVMNPKTGDILLSAMLEEQRKGESSTGAN